MKYSDKVLDGVKSLLWCDLHTINVKRQRAEKQDNKELAKMYKDQGELIATLIANTPGLQDKLGQS